MEHDSRDEIEQEAEHERAERGGPEAETAGDAAAAGLIGPDQPGGPSPIPEIGDGGPPSPPGPAAADPSLAPQERDPSLVTPRMERDEDSQPTAGGAIPASDLPPAERARLAHEVDSPSIPERDRAILRPKKPDED